MDDGTVNDLSGGYQSPQQHMTLKVDGSGLAISLSLLACGAVIAGCILLPQIMESKAKEAAAVGVVRSGQAQQDVALAKHDIQTIQRELNKRGIDIPVN